MTDVPEYLCSTVEMLRAAYPDEVPEKEYFAVLYVLKEKGEMSDRAVAEAVAALKGGRYTHYHYDVAHGLPNKKLKDTLIEHVVEKLTLHGYAAWLEEE